MALRLEGRELPGRLSKRIPLPFKTPGDIGHSGFGRVGVYLQCASGAMRPEALYPSGSLSNSNPQAMAVGHVTGDGRPDIVVYGQLLLRLPVDMFWQRMPRPDGPVAASGLLRP